MKALKMITTVALSATLLCACGSVDKNTIFTINNEPVTKVQFQKEFDTIASNPALTNMGVNLKNNPQSPLYLMLKDIAFPLRCGTRQEWPLLPFLFNTKLKRLDRAIRLRQRNKKLTKMGEKGVKLSY